MPRKKTAPDVTPTISHEDVSAICRLIDHAKKQGIAFFEGPAGIKFGFRRESLAPKVTSKQPAEAGDDFIP